MEDVYSTSDLPLACFLQIRGHQLIGIRHEGRRGVFSFSDNQTLQDDLLVWGNNVPVSIQVRTFINGMRDLKGLIGSERTRR